ncbi:hypothetical protein BJY04DRAFT_88029 [Aspergillus karnatakaensis]|uniref:uncharacterized protein n=1 Tax=Aspergillus karnatakaensis TaxID=1810916 RepID=UPI003CCDBFA7
MTKKRKGWTEAKLRVAISDALKSRHLQNKPINQESIKANYVRKSPNHAQFIKAFVER